jgi:hypothetical protein
MNSDFASRYPRLAEIVGIDLRTLALFRFVLGSVLFCNLLLALTDASAFWTDLGVVPRAWIIEVDSHLRLSLHLVNGETWFIGALLIAQAVLALMYALGWRTRLVNVLSFALWISLMNRNPMVLIGGDILIACLLFWSMFLPVGARWSVDAALATNPPPQRNLHVSWASLGLLMQVMSVYFFSAILKNAPEWTTNYHAVYYALSLDRHVLPLGRLLNDYLPLTQGLTIYVWWLELLGPILIFTPILLRPVRLVLMLCFMTMHLGFWLTLELGHFPFVSFASLTVFFGGWIWDALDRRHQRRHPGPLRIYYDRDCGFCLKTCLLFQQFLILPRAQIAPAQDTPRARTLLEANNSWVVIDADESAHLKWSAFAILLKHSPLLSWLWALAQRGAVTATGDRAYDFVARNRGRFATVTARLLPQRHTSWEVGRGWQWTAAVAIVLVLLWNLTTIHWIPQQTQSLLSPVLRVLRIDQFWNMFAPFPMKEDGWMVVPGRLADGTEVDLMHPDREGPASFERPALHSQDHGNIRWLTYRGRLWEQSYRHHRAYYGKYLCRTWNLPLAGHPEAQSKRLMTLKIIYMLERTQPPGQKAPEIEQVVLWRHECFPNETKGQIP